MDKKVNERNNSPSPVQNVAAQTTLAQSLVQNVYSGTPVDASLLQQAEAVVASKWAVGDVSLDLYEVKEIFTGGGMGLVSRVHHRGWDIDLVVKSPRPNYFQTDMQKENFVRECEMWISLGLHPHIASCYYVRTLGHIPRIFAEYVEGGTLTDWIRTRKLYADGPDQALERMLDVAIQVAWGLHYAHTQDVVHQDVKPANVLLTSEGVAKVTDFGLSRARAAGGRGPSQWPAA